jgi:hypothetical protein
MAFDIVLRDNGSNSFDISLSDAPTAEETLILLWNNEGLI